MVDQDRIGEIADEVVSGYYDYKTAVKEGCAAPSWMWSKDPKARGEYRLYILPTRPPLKHPDLCFSIHVSPSDYDLDEESLRHKLHEQMCELERKPEAERYRVKDSLNG